MTIVMRKLAGNSNLTMRFSGENKADFSSWVKNGLKEQVFKILLNGRAGVRIPVCE